MPPLPRSSADLTIAGNVRGGKHFRASVPYHARSAFQADLGTSYLDSFFRHSSGVNDSVRTQGSITPYYSPSNTVTRTVPGLSGVIHPTLTPITSMNNTRIATGSPNTLSSLEPSAYTLPSYDQTVARALLQLDTHTFPLSTQAQTNRWLRQQQGLPEAPVFDGDPFTTDPSKEQTPGVEEPLQNRITPEDAAHDPMTALQALTPEQWADYFQSLETEEGITSQAEYRPPVTTDTTDATDTQPQLLSHPAIQPSESSHTEFTGSDSGSATLGAYTEARYLHFMALGRRHLQQGQFNAAENAYALAATYKADDPWAQAGKSQALFALRRYSTSALFLERILNELPHYAQISIDLKTLVGGKEQLLERIGELERFLSINPSFDLYFLLGYVYYQTRDIGLAQEAIQEAIQKKPNHRGAQAVKLAIDRKIGLK